MSQQPNAPPELLEQLRRERALGGTRRKGLDGPPTAHDDRDEGQQRDRAEREQMQARERPEAFHGRSVIAGPR